MIKKSWTYENRVELKKKKDGRKHDKQAKV